MGNNCSHDEVGRDIYWPGCRGDRRGRVRRLVQNAVDRSDGGSKIRLLFMGARLVLVDGSTEAVRTAMRFPIEPWNTQEVDSALTE